VTQVNENIDDNTKLERLIVKSEVLIERHKEELNELEEEQNEMEDWISIVFKAIKSVLLH
jgi:uncharacterized membrane protein YjjP (DUF1212 family)